MSEKTKKTLDSINKILVIVCAVAFIAAACRITHYTITEYNDNSHNSVIEKVEVSKNN